VIEKMQGLLPKEILPKLEENERFTELRQLYVLMYAHLREKNGLRAIEAGLLAEQKLQKYTGIISYSQISRVNAGRDPKLYKSVFESVYAKLSQHQGLTNIPMNYGKLKVLDSTAVQLCLKLFPWAKYRDKTGAVKIHTLYDLAVGCPEAFVLTDGLTHDKTQMSKFVVETGMTYLFDRAYLDHKEFDNYCDKGIFFVSRLKKNAVFKIENVNPIKEESPVLSDKTVVLGSYNARMENKVRLVEVVDSSNGEVFFIVTNRFDLTAEEISDIYRLRWSIETFFKWIKQHLKIKKFYSTSFNGILIQIYTALILYCLLKLIHILYCKKFDFLKMVRLIADGLFNSIDYLIKCLTPTKPPPKRERWDNDWKKHYYDVLNLYKVKDYFC
jgi:hypothetical protein